VRAECHLLPYAPQPEEEEEEDEWLKYAYHRNTGESSSTVPVSALCWLQGPLKYETSLECHLLPHRFAGWIN
jgi:hypothetical protein